MVTQLPAYFKSVFVGKHDVEQYQIEGLREGRGIACAPSPTTATSYPSVCRSVSRLNAMPGSSSITRILTMRCPLQSSANGSTSVKVLPTPTSLCRRISPPIASESADHRQADAGTFYSRFLCRIATHKLLEYCLLFIRVDPHPLITHRDQDLVVLDRAIHPHRAAIRRVFHGVFQQVSDCAPECLFVHLNRGCCGASVRTEISFHVKALSFGLFAEISQCRAH